MITYCVFCSACLLFPFNYWKCLKVTNKKNNTIYEITPLPRGPYITTVIYIYFLKFYTSQNRAYVAIIYAYFFLKIYFFATGAIYKTGLPLCMWREQSKSNLIIKIFIRSTTSRLWRLIEKESVCILTPELKVPSPAIPQRGYI